MKSHGHLGFKWSKDILYVEVFGPFNKEGVVEAASIYLDMIANRKCTSFAVIEILDDESLGSPSALDEVSKLWKCLEQYNCTSLAIVSSNIVQHSIIESIIPHIGKVFNRKEDAEQWIHSKGT